MDLSQEIKNHLKNKPNLSLDVIILLVYAIECNQKNDLYLLAKALQEENSLISVISYFGGTSIKVPTVEEYRLYTQIATYFYLTEIMGMKFSEVTEIMKQKGFEVNSISVGKKLSEFKDKLNLKLTEIIEEVL